MKVKRADWQRVIDRQLELEQMARTRVRLMSEHGPLLDLTMEQLSLVYRIAEHGSSVDQDPGWFYAPVRLEVVRESEPLTDDDPFTVTDTLSIRPKPVVGVIKIETPAGVTIHEFMFPAENGTTSIGPDLDFPYKVSVQIGR